MIAVKLCCHEQLINPFKIHKSRTRLLPEPPICSAAVRHRHLLLLLLLLVSPSSNPPHTRAAIPDSPHIQEMSEMFHAPCLRSAGRGRPGPDKGFRTGRCVQGPLLVLEEEPLFSMELFFCGDLTWKMKWVHNPGPPTVLKLPWSH